MSVLYLSCSLGAWNVARAPFLVDKTEGKISPRRSSLRRRIILKRVLKKWDGKAWSGFVRLRTGSLVCILLANTTKNVRVPKTAEMLNTRESGHFLKRIFAHGVLLYYIGIRSSLLLLLWTMRLCFGVISDLRCKYALWDRAQCGNMNLSNLDPDWYPVNIPSLVYLDRDNNGLVALDAGVFRRVTKLRTLILRKICSRYFPTLCSQICTN